MNRELTDMEKNTIKEDLINAILRDGEGYDFKKVTGKYLWMPRHETFTQVTSHQGLIVFTMASTEQQVNAIWTGKTTRAGLIGSTYVCHYAQDYEDKKSSLYSDCKYELNQINRELELR